MKTAIVLLLLGASALGYLNHQYPEKFTKIYRDITGSEPVPVPTPAAVSAPTTPAHNSPNQPIVALVTTAPTPKPQDIVRQVVSAILPIPQPKWVKPEENTDYPKEWITQDGTRYENVKVMDVSPDVVSIMHSNGGGLIEISTLSSDIQKLLHYNPEFAVKAAKDREAREGRNDADFMQSQQVFEYNKHLSEGSSIRDAQIAVVSNKNAEKIKDLQDQINSIEHSIMEARNGYHPDQGYIEDLRLKSEKLKLTLQSVMQSGSIE